MLVIGQVSPTTADDDETAAIVAAISCLISAEQSCTEPSDTGRATTNWKLAGLLESTGRAPRVTRPLNSEIRKKAWAVGKLSNLYAIPLTGLLLFVIVSGWLQPVSAQSPPRAPNAVRSDTTAMPPSAPSYRVRQSGNWLESRPDVNPLTSGNNQQCPDSRAGWQYSEPRPPALLRPSLPEIQTTPPLSDPPVPSNGVPRQPGMLRVALVLDSTNTGISLPDGGTLRDFATGTVAAELPAQSQWQISIKSAGNFGQLCFSGKTNNVAHSHVLVAGRDHYRHVSFTSGAVRSHMVPLPASRSPQFWLPAAGGSDGTSRTYILVPPTDGAFAVAGKMYRGSLLIKPGTATPVANAQSPWPSRPSQTTPPPINSFHLINYVDLEDYLLSVVPSEMPSGWPLEALKAQSIAARSYAVANLGKHESDGYDVKANTEDQVYSGVAAETQSSNRAVAETTGQFVRHRGNVITAYFHSAAGGSTELSDNVWSRSVPYLKSVPDYDDESPHFSWTRSFNPEDAQQALIRNNKDVGTLLAIMPVSRGVSPRIRWLMVSGTDKTLFVSGEQARKIFALPSTLFNIGTVDGAYVFAGRGFGHGLGMSQWGARKLADAGYTAPQILSYYYKDVTIGP